jgi:hypothetical protein
MSPTLLPSVLTIILLFQTAYSAVLNPRAMFDFGECRNSRIAYVKGTDSFRGCGCKPANQKDFLHGAKADFAAISNFIYQRLQNECLAPASTVGLYDWGAPIGSTAKDKHAADAFNENLMRDMNPTHIPKLKPTPKLMPKPEYNIETKLSSQQVEYDGDLDLLRWFDNRMITDDPSNGTSCPIDWFHLVDSKAIKLTCSFPDGSVEKPLRTAMNTLIQESVTNSSIATDEKPFSRYTTKSGGCNRGGCPKAKPYSRFPMVDDMKLFNLMGDRNEEQGTLRYEISVGSSPSCKVCDYLSRV